MLTWESYWHSVRLSSYASKGKWLTMRRTYSSKKLLTRFFPLVIGGILFVLFSAQINPPQPKKAAEFIRAGQIIWGKGDYDSAYALFHQAQRLAKVENDTFNWLDATFHVGKYYSRTGYVEEAGTKLDSVIEWQNRVNPLTKSIVLARNEKAFVSMISLFI